MQQACSSKSCYAKRKQHFTAFPKLESTVAFSYHSILWHRIDFEPETKFEVIPSSDEYDISLSVGVFIKKIESEAGQQVPIFEYMRLIDSFNFMPQSFASLIADLPDNRFDILSSMYKSYSIGDFQILCQKGFLLVFIRTGVWRKVLPPLSEWKKNIAWRWIHYQRNRLPSCSNSVFKIWLSKHSRLPWPLSIPWYVALGVCLWGLQRYLLWHVRFRMRTVLWGIIFIIRCLPQGVQTRLAFANRERAAWTCKEHHARRSVFNLWATNLSSKQLPSAKLGCFCAVYICVFVKRK